MALTVTPGGPADDSLLSLDDFDTYCTNFGHTVTATDGEKEVALRKATLWVEGLGTRGYTMAYRWPGTLVSGTQLRAWPRAGATRPDGTAISSATIPVEVENAVAEAAVYELSNPGTLFAVLTPSEVVTSEAVGPIKVAYATGNGLDDARPMLTIVNDMLSNILIPETRGAQGLMLAAGMGDTSWR